RVVAACPMTMGRPLRLASLIAATRSTTTTCITSQRREVAMTTRPQGLAGVLYAWTGFCLRQRLSQLVLLGDLGFWGLVVAPFEWGSGLPRNPVAVDAIPNLGENQQLIYADWPGRSPREVEDQITYPLGSALLGVPGVKDLRSLSMQGFASIAVIFDDQVDVYWARSRLLEKLASLPPGSL